MSTRLRLFPLNAVLFPGAVLNLHVFEARYKQLIEECLQTGEGFGVVLIREGHEAGDPAVQPHAVGSIAEIREVTPLPFGRFYVSTVGCARFQIRAIVAREPYLVVEADALEDEREDGEGADLRARVAEQFLVYLQLIGQFSGDEQPVEVPADPQSASFIIADSLQISDAMKQRLLELQSTKERLEMELELLNRLLPQLKKMLERREHEAERRAKQPAREDKERARQERYFGKYFSPN